jgi:hypothetical protein
VVHDVSIAQSSFGKYRGIYRCGWNIVVMGAVGIAVTLGLLSLYLALVK